MTKGYGGQFTSKLFKWTGGGAGTFVQVPDRLAPPVTHGWGRTPVHAAVDGNEWKTSVWRGKDGWMLDTAELQPHSRAEIAERAEKCKSKNGNGCDVGVTSTRP